MNVKKEAVNIFIIIDNLFNSYNKFHNSNAKKYRIFNLYEKLILSFENET
jgi:hypothetical protein